MALGQGSHLPVCTGTSTLTLLFFSSSHVVCVEMSFPQGVVSQVWLLGQWWQHHLKTIFFLSSVCSWFLSLTCRIRWNLTVRTFGTSSSLHWCLVKLENIAVVEVSVKAQELTFTKQLKQQVLSASWQITNCSRQRWTWSIQSDLAFFVVDNNF